MTNKICDSISNSLRTVSVTTALLFSVLVVEGQTRSAATVWNMGDKHFPGKVQAIISGKPLVKKEGKRKFLWFDGQDDGLVINGNPIENLPEFTIEMLFKPAGDGPIAPRMMHFQDKAGNRGTFEARLVGGKLWYLDTFLKNGTTNKGTTLIDSTQTHPVDRWYWVALTFDGKKMTSFVNGIKELEAEMDFPGLGASETALGVRLNKVSWFKGGIKEIRFTPFVLDGPQLQKEL